MRLKPIFLLLSGFEWMRASNEGCDDSRQFGRLRSLVLMRLSQVSLQGFDQPIKCHFVDPLSLPQHSHRFAKELPYSF